MKTILDDKTFSKLITSSSSEDLAEGRIPGQDFNKFFLHLRRYVKHSESAVSRYRKIPIISPVLCLYICPEGFSKGLIVGGNFAFQNVLTIKTA